MGRLPTQIGLYLGRLRMGTPIVLLWIYGLAKGHGLTACLMRLSPLVRLSPLTYHLYLLHVPIARFYWLATRPGILSKPQFWYGVAPLYPFPIEWWEVIILIAICLILGAAIDQFLTPIVQPHTVRWGVWICDEMSSFFRPLTKPATASDKDSAVPWENHESVSTEYLIKEKVQGLTGVAVTRNSNLADLGLDSLGTTALLSTIRSATPLAKKLLIHDISSIDTVGNLVDFLEGDSRNTMRTYKRTSSSSQGIQGDTDEEAGLAAPPTTRTLRSNGTKLEKSFDGTVAISSSPTEQHAASVIFCHGLGGTADSFISFTEHLAEQMPHVKFILPTAPTQPVTKEGTTIPSWYDIVGHQDRSKETCEGIGASVSKIRTIIRDEHERTGLPYSRMVLAGFSQGGALSLFTGMQLEEGQGPLAGIVLLSGYLPRPESFVVTRGLEGTPILHLHGESDDVVPYEAGNDSCQRALKSGARMYEMRGYSGLGHSISPEEIGDMSNFLRRVLPPSVKLMGHSSSRTSAASVGRNFGGFRRSHLVTIALLVVALIAVIVLRETRSDKTSVFTYSPLAGSPMNVLLDPEQFRYNKFSPLSHKLVDDSNCSARMLPLGPTDYPISGSPDAALAQCMLKNNTDAVSVVASDDWECGKLDVADLINAVGGPPPQPLSEVGGYWDQLERVMDVQKIRLKRGHQLARIALPEFPLPYQWAEFTVNDVASAVHDEYPGSHQAQMIADLMSGTYGRIELDTSIIPQRSRVHLLRGIFALADLNEWAIGRVGPYNFAAKWHVGRARPEEMVAAVQSGVLSYVPPSIQKKAEELPRTSRATDFTAYPEGSPRHPSWPAMHAAASGLSFWLSIVLDLTPEQHCQVKLIDFAVAWARTVAGVHYEDDNIAGLDMGQEVMARLLPEHLADTYGADLATVHAKVEAMRFSWREFDMKNPCPGTEWMLWECKSRTRRCGFRGPV